MAGSWMNSVGQEVMNTILLTFNQTEIKAPVAKSMFTQGDPRHCRQPHQGGGVCTRGGKRDTFDFIGPIAANGRGNYMLVEGSKTPFELQIPGLTDSSLLCSICRSSTGRTARCSNTDRTISQAGGELSPCARQQFCDRTQCSMVSTLFINSAVTDVRQFNPEIGNYYLNQFKRLELCRTLPRR